MFTMTRIATMVLLSAVMATIVKGDNSDPETVGNVNLAGLVKPTNNTRTLISDFKLSVNSSQGSDIMVLTDVAAMGSGSNGANYKNSLTGLETICSGQAILGRPDSDIQQNNVVFVSCDDSNNAGTLLDHIANANPACTIMYSLQYQACNFTNNDDGQFESRLGTVFTMLSSAAGKSILNRVNSTTALNAYVRPAESNDPNTSSNQSSSTTTVAMAVLYSITGVIAAAFLFIIISGAVRVHKHPERYGLTPAGGNSSPNNNSSDDGNNEYTNKAKGLARAVLDSIPLVTFTVGNQQRGQSSDLDVESQQNSKDSLVLVDQKGDEKGEDTEKCPICFERFEDGEIMRALPCKHNFHAICVDPWLLNTSSHCPLCRIDLSLEQNEQVSENPPDESDHSIVIPPGYQPETSMFNRFLDIWNAQLLPKESRRAVLAQFQREADLRRQLRLQRSEQQQEQNRNLWIRFVNSRRNVYNNRRNDDNNT